MGHNGSREGELREGRQAWIKIGLSPGRIGYRLS
jgi:hypothetical protein